MAALREAYLDHARPLLKQGSGYQIHGWEGHSHDVEKWIEASANVLARLKGEAQCSIDTATALRQLAVLHGKAVPQFEDTGLRRRRRGTPDDGKPRDDVKLAIDALLAALDEAIG